jgi:hypothetical protein
MMNGELRNSVYYNIDRAQRFHKSKICNPKSQIMAHDFIGKHRDDFVKTDSACAINYVRDSQKNLQDPRRNGFPAEMPGLQKFH